MATEREINNTIIPQAKKPISLLWVFGFLGLSVIGLVVVLAMFFDNYIRDLPRLFIEYVESIEEQSVPVTDVDNDQSSQEDRDPAAAELASKLSDLLNQQEYKAALDLVKQSGDVSIYRDYSLENMIGWVYNANHLFEEAIDHLTYSIELNSNFRPARNNLCISLSEIGDLAGAERECLEAIRIDPSSSRAYMNLAHIYVNIEKPDLARQNYLKALEIENQYPTMDNHLKAALYDNLARFAYLDGDCNKAIALSEQALELDSKDYYAIDRISLCRSVMTSFPDDPSNWPSLDDGQNVANCQEDDGGLAQYKFGNAVATGGDVSRVEASDFCRQDSIVEFYCLPGRLMTYSTQCPNGCAKGACIK